MNLTTLKTDIAEAVANDATIKAWANTMYGQDHFVYIDADTRNIPEANKCPMIVFTGIGSVKNQEERVREYAVNCVAVVHDDTTAATGIANLVRYNGPDRAEAFRQMIADVVQGLYNDKFVEIETDIDALEFFPLCKIEMNLFFREPITIGQDPLA